MKKKRIMAVLLTLAMAMGLAPATALADGASRPAIQLGTDRIRGYNADTGYDYIYFGTYDETPVLWRVLDTKTNFDEETSTGLFMLSEYLFPEYTTFGMYYKWGDEDNSSEGYKPSNVWDGSKVQKWCQDFAKKAFGTETPERSAVVKSDADVLNNDEVFLLSKTETTSENYGFTTNDSRKADANPDIGQNSKTWWLRTPYDYIDNDNPDNDVHYVWVVRSDGTHTIAPVGYDDEDTNTEALRPAFNLDKSKVLLVSPAEGGKTATTLTAVESTDTTEWKLTLLDDTHNGFSTTTTAVTVGQGQTVSVNYTGAATGKNEYISAIVQALGGKIYYSRLQAVGENAEGSVSITIPEDLTVGAEYTLKLFNEQCNGNKKTDYASNFKDIELTVTPAAPTFSPNGGKITGETQVTITAKEGETIYYTTDGSDPADESNTKRVQSAEDNGSVIVTVTPGTTLKAVATLRVAALTSEVTTATFEKKTSSGGGGGGGGGSSTTTTTNTTTVEKAEHGKVTVSPEKAAKGETVTVTATPDAGYQLDKVTVLDKNGDKVELETVKEGEKYTFKMPETKVTVTAAFTEAKTDETKDETKEEPKDETKAETTLPFTDVKTNDWFYGDVAYANSTGLMYGTTETTFAPKLSTTRGMITTVLHRLEGKPAATKAATFTDVASGMYYENAIAWAAENAVANGYGDGKFGPNDTITREQLAAMLYRYAAFKGIDTTASASLAGFTDGAQASAYAVPALQWAVAEKLVYGDDNGALRPTAQVTRAEAAALLHRFIENVNK